VEGHVRSDKPDFLDPNSHEEGGIEIYLKLNYKVLLLVFTVADLLHTSVNEVIVRWLRSWLL
jgi:ribosome biogenesis GTPase A